MAPPLSSPATPLPTAVAFQLATSSHEPPAGDGWLYEVKHDGHRLAVLTDGDGGLRLLSRNGYERSRHFGAAFADLARLGRQVVLDGEITAPDERGLTHLDDLAGAMQRRDTAALAYFAFDILHLDDHDLRRCPLVERKAILAELLRAAGCPRLLYVDYVDDDGDRLLDAVRKVGAEGIVAKRRAGLYHSGPSREWLKTTCSEVGKFVITGFRDTTPGTIEAVTVAEVVDDKLLPAGEVQFGVGRRLREALEAIRLDPRPGRRRVPVRPIPAARSRIAVLNRPARQPTAIKSVNHPFPTIALIAPPAMPVTVTTDTAPCNNMSILAVRVSGNASVGLNAKLVVKPMNK
jgi:bifunctional non-homologous end joining protein LigD